MAIKAARDAETKTITPLGVLEFGYLDIMGRWFELEADADASNAELLRDVSLKRLVDVLVFSGEDEKFEQLREIIALYISTREPKENNVPARDGTCAEEV
jgi:hypothetical protein